MKPRTYCHFEYETLPQRGRHAPLVEVEDAPAAGPPPLRLALYSYQLGQRLGVTPPRDGADAPLPYADHEDRLVFEAPLASLAADQRLRYLRGWKHYGGCIKGFNALGLLAEHAWKERTRLAALPAAERTAARREFLRSRRTAGPEGLPRPLYGEAELAALSDAALEELDLDDVALWRAYAARPIVCSTSSNMGISLHEALRYMQRPSRAFAGRAYPILNSDEGWLIIWCPDEQADFMNSEKTEHLRSLESEQPALTVLHTYINRKERDPGALRDALVDGGYFFPTNPQSADELQNLLSLALDALQRERTCSREQLLADPKLQFTLASLGCRIEADRVRVLGGVEGGLHGLMTAYLLLLEETLARGDAEAVSAWNQASIGAALAAAVLADDLLREPERLSAEERDELRRLCPRLHGRALAGEIGRGFSTRIHGVFDLANLQSLAQLLGVVVERHMSGRGTAFVGLGSSSYANGNRCYEILKRSAEREAAFRGGTAFHPATHTLSPVAQALVFADDLVRTLEHPDAAGLSLAARVELVRKHARKPEPAGAAALAGYLLTRLDGGTLSLVEIAAALRLGGFDGERFLEFAGYGGGPDAGDRFVQEAGEEGPWMAGLAAQWLSLLDADPAWLCAQAARERQVSRRRYREQPLDDAPHEARAPAVNLYLTGDNTRQPAAPLVRRLVQGCLELRGLRTAALDAGSAASLRRAG